MGLIFNLSEWERSERSKLISNLEEYVEDVKMHLRKAWQDPEEREKLLRAIGEETLNALQQMSLARVVLGSESSGYFPVSPDLVLSAVLLLLNLCSISHNEKQEEEPAP